MISRLGRAIGHVVFRSRDVLAPVTVLMLVVSARPGDFLVSPACGRWLDALGALTMLLGLAIRFLVVATCRIRRSGVRKRVIAPTLYDTGAYAWCRNPLYIGNATILVGLGLIFDSRWMVACALPTALLAIGSIVAAEERVLANDFGDRYHDYCRRVPRFVPRLPFPTRPVGMAIDWQRGIRKEHGTIFATLTTALLLAGTEEFARMGNDAWFRRAPALLGLWLAAATLWAFVRHLKHAGRLADAVSSTTEASATSAQRGDVAA